MRDVQAMYSDAKYDEAIYLSAVAGAYSSWGCGDSVCRADSEVDGNQVEHIQEPSAWAPGAHSG